MKKGNMFKLHVIFSVNLVLFLVLMVQGNCVGQTEEWIIYGSNQDGDQDIWAIKPDGTGEMQLTNMVGHENFPQWSPDCTKFAYTANNTSQILIYDWTTGTSTKIYDKQDYGSYGVYSPSWSPDGSKILFREDASYNNPHITVINSDGTSRAVIPAGGYVSSPSWSPDGLSFVYDRRNTMTSYTHDLWIYDFTDTGNIMNGINHRLTEGANSESTTKFEPDWMPNGNIVFAWGHNIAVIDPGQSGNWGDSSNPDITFLTNDASYPSIRYVSPSWSPDSSKIVYARDSAESHYDLWIMDSTGQNPFQLMSSSAGEGQPDWGIVPEPVISALIDINPDTLNKKSHGKWITAYITLPDGFDVATIDTSSIAITSLIGESCDPEYTQEADLSFTPQVGDRDEDGILDLTVKFDRQVLLANLCLDDVSITIEGKLTTDELFSGTDSIRIIDRGK